MNRAFFLDRDGVLNVDTNFVHTPDEWQWCDGAVEALQWMTENRFPIIVLTNQSGITRGHYTVQDVKKLHRWVDQQLKETGIHVDAWLMAPHHPKFDPGHQFPPEDRKPGTGMFQKAIEEFEIDPRQSYMAGDKVTDLIPAVKLGITPFFIRSRHEPKQDKDWLRKHEIPVCNRLYDATHQLLG